MTDYISAKERIRNQSFLQRLWRKWLVIMEMEHESPFVQITQAILIVAAVIAICACIYAIQY